MKESFTRCFSNIDDNACTSNHSRTISSLVTKDFHGDSYMGINRGVIERGFLELIIVSILVYTSEFAGSIPRNRRRCLKNMYLFFDIQKQGI